jgi:hypothetical protein
VPGAPAGTVGSHAGGGKTLAKNHHNFFEKKYSLRNRNLHAERNRNRPIGRPGGFDSARDGQKFRRPKG